MTRRGLRETRLEIEEDPKAIVDGGHRWTGQFAEVRSQPVGRDGPDLLADNVAVRSEPAFRRRNGDVRGDAPEPGRYRADDDELRRPRAEGVGRDDDDRARAALLVSADGVKLSSPDVTSPEPSVVHS